MSEILRRICILSCFFGAAVSFIPERGIKQIAELLCTCILIICILEPFADFDWTTLSTEMALVRNNEKMITDKSEETKRSLSKSATEEEYSSYILEKAERKGIILTNVNVEVRWSDEGIWIPWRTYIECKETGAKINGLSETIEAELGVPKERQDWNY